LENSSSKLLFYPGLLLSNALLAGLPASQVIQNAETRVIFNEPKRTHVTHLFINSHWFPIAARIKFKVLMFAYRRSTDSAPLYLNVLLQTYLPSKRLRANERRLVVPFQKCTKSLSDLQAGAMSCLSQPELLSL